MHGPPFTISTFRIEGIFSKIQLFPGLSSFTIIPPQHSIFHLQEIAPQRNQSFLTKEELSRSALPRPEGPSMLSKS
ncbi:MAG: hypothetical protein DMG06_29770 [Acidobacteria bacterium]|nr:MAG: hypothetical protein DMG06_29770 [Acidobacteriota bacterium]